MRTRCQFKEINHGIYAPGSQSTYHSWRVVSQINEMLNTCLADPRETTFITHHAAFL